MTTAGASRTEALRGISVMADPIGADESPALTVAAVARRLGVAPATLRTWDRRYGLGPSEHTAGAHRRYTSVDTERLLVMRRLTLEGVAPAEAARIARTTGPAAEATASGQSAAGEQRPAGWAPAEWGRSSQPAAREPPAARLLSHHPGAAGQQSGDDRADPTLVTPALIEALARAHDVGACAHALTVLLAGRSIAGWWTGLVEPASRSLAAPAGAARPADDPRTMLAAAVLAALRERLGDGPESAHEGGPRILVRPAATSSWLMTAHVLAAATEVEGIAAGILAPGADSAQVLDAVDEDQVEAVVILGVPQERDAQLVQALHTSAPDLPLFVHPGAGDVLDGVPWGEQIHRLRTFTGALHEVLAVCS